MTERELPIVDRGIDAAVSTEDVFSNTAMPAHVNGQDLDRDGIADVMQVATNGGRIQIQTEIARGEVGRVVVLDDIRAELLRGAELREASKPHVTVSDAPFYAALKAAA